MTDLFSGKNEPSKGINQAIFNTLFFSLTHNSVLPSPFGRMDISNFSLSNYFKLHVKAFISIASVNAFGSSCPYAFELLHFSELPCFL